MFLLVFGAQRGQPLRMVEAARRLRRRWRRRVADGDRRVGAAARVRARRLVSCSRSTARTARRSAGTATRCSSSASCATTASATACSPRASSRWASSACSSCSRCSCRTAEHLTRSSNGLWMLPVGIFLLIGAQLGGRLTHRISTTYVVRIGIVLEVIGLVDHRRSSIHPGLTLRRPAAPAGLIFGFGIGFASSQLTNVVLSDIDRREVGGGERRELHGPPGRRRARRRGDRRRVREPHRAQHHRGARASRCPRR